MGGALIVYGCKFSNVYECFPHLLIPVEERVQLFSKAQFWGRPLLAAALLIPHANGNYSSTYRQNNPPVNEATHTKPFYKSITDLFPWWYNQLALSLILCKCAEWLNQLLKGLECPHPCSQSRSSLLWSVGWKGVCQMPYFLFCILSSFNLSIISLNFSGELIMHYACFYCFKFISCFLSWLEKIDY